MSLPTFGDPIIEMMQKQLKPQSVEYVICAKCKKLNGWMKIRKILDERGDFVDYRCMDCVKEGNKVE